MRKKHIKNSFITAVLLMAMGLSNITAFAETTSDDKAVTDVIAQLEAIDTLQEMQDARSNYTVSSNYDASDPDSVAEHEEARSGYETYTSNMFAARKAAQAAYSDRHHCLSLY